MSRKRTTSKKRSTEVKKLVQFDWRGLWNERVAPYLDEELVQESLGLGMYWLDRNWKRGDAPCKLGTIGMDPAVEGELSWYQPLNRCHEIAFFALAVGVLNYPELNWKVVTGDAHSVAVGFDDDGNPSVVMDILQFERFTAEESIAFTKEKMRVATSPGATKKWNMMFRMFETNYIPFLKERAQELRASQPREKDASRGS